MRIENALQSGPAKQAQQRVISRRAVVSQVHLPYPLLSDEHLLLAKALSLPTFTAAGMTLLKRMTMVVNDGVIEHVFYPVFPPDQNATEVLAWLKTRCGK
ncbi:redoxin family protein [Burkholderia sp. L27(2015)]|uniref:redoxin family protein n=1 Tax=Burkholderia sp. L27(2015) TaxID=1641858 RepID=UPI00131DB2CE|nr:redoxin family protein [Burkholderia sp. L27(2015)]